MEQAHNLLAARLQKMQRTESQKADEADWLLEQTMLAKVGNVCTRL